MPTSPQNAVPGYDLAQPTEGDAMSFLARAQGPDRAATLWMRLCRDAGVRSGHLSIDDLERVVQALSREGGVAGVIGNSLQIRLRTYRLLDRARRLGAEGGR